MTELLYTFAKITTISNGAVELSTGQKLTIDRKAAPNHLSLGKYYWVAWDPATNQIKRLSYELTSTGNEINLAYENLTSWSDKAVKALEELETADRMIVLRCAGMAFSAAACIGSTASMVGSIMAWEPLSAITSGAVAVATGYVTYIQYEELTPAMKRRVDILKRFKLSAECFRQLQLRDFPTAWESDEEVYFIVNPEPKAKSLTTKLIRLFPNLSIEDFYYDNGFNWSMS